jgi:glutamine synthetase
MPVAYENRLALANPISLIVDKPSAEFTREDLLRVIEELNIEQITFHYTGLDGRYKELKIPVTSREVAERILTDGERVDGSSLFAGVVDTTLSDLYVIPVYKTAFVNPFDEKSLDLTCRYFTSDGELAPFAPDTILHRAAALFRRETGMELYALCELEFFLLSDREPNVFPGMIQRGYHESSPFVKTGHILNEMARCIAKITGAVKYAHSEVGYVECVSSNVEEINGKRAEQLEIEFLPTPVEDVGDYVVLARWLIRNIAYRHGCLATFAPKIEEGVAGNGQHVHVELLKNGRNAMTDEQGELSTQARKVIGGLCTYADSLVAFGNTVPSAYLRLVPNQEAPTHICWSDLNRSAMIRVPLGWSHLRNLAARINPQQRTALGDQEGRQTVEIRTPDGSALDHLLLAGITLAAEWGLSSNESLEIAGNLCTTANVFRDETLLKQLRILPKSCVESSRILLQKRSLYEREGIFPASVIDFVAKMLQAEDDENMNSYLAGLPADSRLSETRRIMHKDIHRH